MDTTIGVGLLGLGSIGRTHAQALAALRPEVTLTAYSGGTSSAAAQAGWPGAQRMDPQDVTSDPEVDIVVICSPSGSHAQQALAALAAGKHVVVEKPLALSVLDAESVVVEAERAGRMVSVMAQRRMEPEVAATYEALRSGALGAVRLVTTQVNWWRGEEYYAQAAWRGSTAAGGGSLINQGVHNIDLLRWLAGEVESVTAQSGTLAHDTEAEDTTVATLRLRSGGLGMVSTSTATPPGTPASLALYCEHGTVEIGQSEILRWDVEGVPVPETGGSEVIGVGASDPAAIGIAGHIQQWRDVLDALHAGREPSIGARDGAATVRLLVAIAEAARTGRLIRTEEHA